ncbi:Alpha-D-ribose 1-methylphosphonate 5-triphosphate diphosphatase [Paenibacillus solanacearum]|uniref:Alpha-D-ribose 1-methylphosphonate 5-triphosphate diphosphatase n=1 Tax=Paenibacillus solanacearum TaxID=2048548 RepID=A0A916K1V8_9BACL|nr:alpha-D-ribose 1-methylphosphonate 5-triphosphate diphosphatase [Paenibacillus solanacearum]CAG7629236.1 Alpha-D-ribose 1-methylphosphonate 5-triphosphate diphosphatase [Paenibacillus solanacearum]
MTKQGKWIIDALLVLPDKVMQGSLFIDGSTIANIVEDKAPHSLINLDKHEVIDARGAFVLPGLIDIHCDAIEKEVQPRPNTLFPMDLALYELEKKLAGNGITTMYQSISLGVGLSLRGDELVVQLIDHIRRYRDQRSMIRHRVHLRYELIHLAGLQLAEELIRAGAVDYMSFMNHGPGQGQYKRPGSFEAYVMKNQGVDKEEVKKIAENALQKQAAIDWEDIRALSQLAHQHRIPIASHDDDSEETIMKALEFGVTVSEFPLNLETAAYAKDKQLYVCVGAPNVVRGGSHDKNMRAIDAIHAGTANIVCSDYLPSSLLAAVFTIAEDERMSLSDAVNMASLNPAKAMGIDRHFGSIEQGKAADLLLVQSIEGYPWIQRTIVDGTTVYLSDFFHGTVS